MSIMLAAQRNLPQFNIFTQGSANRARVSVADRKSRAALGPGKPLELTVLLLLLLMAV